MGLGAPKALLSFRGEESLLDRLAFVFSSAGCDVWGVTGAKARLLRDAHPMLDFVHNRGWRRGQYSSVRIGLAKALALGADEVLLHPVDLPFLRPSTVSRLRHALKHAPDGVVVPSHQGQWGHPLALTRLAAERILRMRSVPHLRAALDRLGRMELALQDPGILAEVDTPEDHQRHFKRPPRQVARMGGTRRHRTRTPG